MKVISYKSEVRSLKIFYGCVCAGLSGLLLVYFFPQRAVAQQDKKEVNVKVEMKEVQGSVNNISAGYISITYQRDKEKGVEYEILLPVDENIKIEHKKSLDEINTGDIVNVQYEEKTEEYETGPMRQRKALVIKFIKAAEDEDKLRSMETGE